MQQPLEKRLHCTLHYYTDSSAADVQLQRLHCCTVSVVVLVKGPPAHGKRDTDLRCISRPGSEEKGVGASG